MRKDFGARTWLFPMPVLLIATYDENGNPDVMNAAWGGIHDTNQIGICLSAEHKTTKNILARRAFTVSPAIVSQTVAADFVGLVSANDTPDKFARTGWHAVKGTNADAPVIAELPLALECRFVSYDEASGFLVGDIVNVTADESVLTDGKPDMDKLQPIVFNTFDNTYRAVGIPVADAFSAGKKLI